jgi:tryptophan synthase alpha chain
MSPISKRFSDLQSKNEKALVLFVTAGDQPLDQLSKILETLVAGGADLIEIGIPFSDPFGEGPTIQASSQRALDAGATPASIAGAVSKYASPVPMVAMGYYNNFLSSGGPTYLRTLQDAGISGTIVSDLVPDEADSWCGASADAGMDTIFLAAPTSTENRLLEATRRSTGFVYAVSRTGVTGAAQQVPLEVQGLVNKIKDQTSVPVCVGFGVSTPDHVRMVCEVADGAVVGSALVDLLHRVWNDGKGAAEIQAYVASLKAATHAG